MRVGCQDYFEQALQSLGIIELFREINALDCNTVAVDNRCGFLHGCDGAGPSRWPERRFEEAYF
jgi:hypothetical protein